MDRVRRGRRQRSGGAGRVRRVDRRGADPRQNREIRAANVEGCSRSPRRAVTRFARHVAEAGS
jgi:hypothetical protein